MQSSENVVKNNCSLIQEHKNKVDIVNNTSAKSFSLMEMAKTVIGLPTIISQFKTTVVGSLDIVNSSSSTKGCFL